MSSCQLCNAMIFLQVLSLAFSAICKVTASKVTAKLLLLAHLANYIKRTFVVVNQKKIWRGCFAPTCLLRLGETASAPSCATVWHQMHTNCFQICSITVLQGSGWAIFKYGWCRNKLLGKNPVRFVSNT